jgi:hypothetical protein
MIDPFWSSRPVLQHVLATARARGAGPWSTLGSAMAHATAMIPHDVVIPGIVGGRMSANLFVAIVGPSGGGKGASEAAAAAGFRFGGTCIETTPLGTGEGVARTFRPIGTKPEDENPISTAIFTSSEIDSYAAIASRSGSTVSAELRKMYSGEQLGFGNAGKDARVIVPAGSYRACLTISVQPLRSHALLGASDGGLPQRFVWLPTSDHDAPDEPPDDPGVWKINRPSWLRAVGTKVDLIVPDAAVKAIRSHRLAVLREEPNVDALDGHALLTRLKVAVSLMALDGRTVVSDDDWKLAGFVMDVSNYTRQRCQRALDDQSRNVNRARALATAERDEIITDRKLQRCKDGILRALDRVGDRGIAHSQLRRALKSDVRDNFDAAIAELVAEHRVSPRRTPKGMVYQGPPVDHRSTPSEQAEQGVDPGPPVDHQGHRQRQRTRGRYRASQQTTENAS